ncbi:MAG: hypothetical protein NT067_05915 [Candidatus Diapherotrites archaeon]|nr:hypothetical protein [Candidatus Diapherotrites archaeon]
MEKKVSGAKKILLAAFLLVVSYMAIYLLSNYAGGIFSKLPGIGTFFPFYDWRFDSKTISPMYALMPVIGFLAVYFLVFFTKREFDWGFVESAKFPVALIILSLFAFYFVPVYFYSMQSASVAEQDGYTQTCFYRFEKEFGKTQNVSAQKEMGNEFNSGNCLWDSCFNCANLQFDEVSGGTRTAVQKAACQINYWKCFGQSAFLIFIFGAIAGWISFRLQKIIEGQF